ncbi:hypothetical protein QE152_g30213, partial [Popillia japonica]
SLFGKEFVLFPIYEQEEFEMALEMLQEVNVVKIDNCIHLQSNTKLEQLLCNLVQPFFITYYLVCSVLNSMDECVETHVYSVSQAQIEKLLYARKSMHPYTLNLDTISNCLQNLCDLKAIKRIRKNTSAAYIIQKEILSNISRKLSDYIPSLIPGFNMPVTAKL